MLLYIMHACLRWVARTSKEGIQWCSCIGNHIIKHFNSCCREGYTSCQLEKVGMNEMQHLLLPTCRTFNIPPLLCFFLRSCIFIHSTLVLYLLIQLNKGLLCPSHLFTFFQHCLTRILSIYKV